jgi:hypothetical protein
MLALPSQTNETTGPSRAAFFIAEPVTGGCHHRRERPKAY